MARLGVDINLALQRLLGANKQRAAANRESLQDRQTRKDNAAQKAEASKNSATPAGVRRPEERRGGTPDLYKRPDPAAQRRKKPYTVFAVRSTEPYAVAGTEQNFHETFTAYRANYSYLESTHEVLSSSISSYTRANSYSLQDTKISPFFEQERKNSTRVWGSDYLVIPDHLTAFDWTFRQKAYFGGLIDDVFAVTPGLDIDLKTIQTADYNPASDLYYDDDAFIPQQFTSCDGRYIYHSKLIRQRVPLDNFFKGQYIFSKDGLFDPDYFQSFDIDADRPPPVISGSSRIIFVAGYERWTRRVLEYNALRSSAHLPSSHDTWTGLYWVFDTKNPDQASLRTVTVHQGTDEPDLNGRASGVATFFNLLNSGDPIYRLWQSTSSFYSTYSDLSKITYFLRQDISPLSAWPPGMAYDYDRGLLTLVTTPNGTSRPHVFSKKVTTPAQDYASTPGLNLPGNYVEYLTTIQQYVDAGWELRGFANLSNSTPSGQYFAILP